jgi:hypothetical protein
MFFAIYEIRGLDCDARVTPSKYPGRTWPPLRGQCNKPAI